MMRDKTVLERPVQHAEESGLKVYVIFTGRDKGASVCLWLDVTVMELVYVKESFGDVESLWSCTRRERKEGRVRGREKVAGVVKLCGFIEAVLVTPTRTQVRLRLRLPTPLPSSSSPNKYTIKKRK